MYTDRELKIQREILTREIECYFRPGVLNLVVFKYPPINNSTQIYTKSLTCF
jgi:hypothetical protein